MQRLVAVVATVRVILPTVKIGAMMTGAMMIDAMIGVKTIVPATTIVGVFAVDAHRVVAVVVDVAVAVLLRGSM